MTVTVPMTVGELIRQLQTMPQDHLVVTDGYEDGYDTIKRLSLLKVKEEERKDWFYAKYDSTNDPNALEVVYLHAETKADNK